MFRLLDRHAGTTCSTLIGLEVAYAGTVLAVDHPSEDLQLNPPGEAQLGIGIGNGSGSG